MKLTGITGERYVSAIVDETSFNSCCIIDGCYAYRRFIVLKNTKCSPIADLLQIPASLSRVNHPILISHEQIHIPMSDTSELRQMIKEIDQEIIENIAVRMEIADKLAEAKKAAGQIYWDDAKEKEVIQRYMELCEDVNMTEAEAKKIAEVILSISKERQKHFFE